MAYVKTCNGNCAIGCAGFNSQNWLPKAVNSSGAVSPVTRAIANSNPVVIAGRAAGTTIRIVVANSESPSASAPSRIERGTLRMASSEVRKIIGSISIANATDADNAEKCRNGATSNVYANNPIAMLGIPDNTSERKRTASGNQPRPNNAKKQRAKQAHRQRQERRDRDGDQRADDTVGDAAAGLAHGHRQLREKRGVDRARAGKRNVSENENQDRRADQRTNCGIVAPIQLAA